MKSTLLRSALVAAALAVPALGQDSTVKDPGVNASIGDAVMVWEDATGPYGWGSEQRNTFVVDTVPFTSSWGKNYRVAPLIKSSKLGFNYLSSQLSAQAISNTQLTGVPYPFASYSVWSQPGYGVNNFWNNTPASVAPGGLSNQFAVGFAEYGRSDPNTAELNNVVGGVVNYDPANPARLYVTRVAAAQGGANENENKAQFGFGSVDADGNLHFRADDFGVSPPDPLFGDNEFRVRLLGRNPNARNVINLFGAGDGAASDWILQLWNPTGTTSDTFSPPCIVPQHIAGRPVMITTNYNKEYAFEQTAGSLSTTTSHRPATSSDNRGCMSFSTRLTCGGRVGTAASLAYLPFGTGVRTHALDLWGVAADGSVVPNSSILYTPVGKLPLDPNGSFGQYRGVHGYRGGNGLVAVGADTVGRGLAASTWTFTDSATEPNNAILVARFDCGNTDPNNVNWVIAADNRPGLETPILNGPNGTPIGTLARRMSGLNYVGPSMSPPAFDAAGNVYFLSVCRMFEDPNDYYPYSLIRGVYNPATFSYQLELLLESGSSSAGYGDVFHGANSNRDYKVTWLTLGYDQGLAGGTFFSGNVLQTGYAGASVAGLPVGDSRALGGLVLNAEITYDTNGNGSFNDGFGVDERYNVLLFISGDGTPIPPGCAGDANCDHVVSWRDIDYFIAGLNDNQAAWQALFPAPGPTCSFLPNLDINGDGHVTWRDIDPFIARLNTTCPR